MPVLWGALAIWAGHTNYIHGLFWCRRMLRRGGSQGRSGIAQVWGQGLMAGHANYIEEPGGELHACGTGLVMLGLGRPGAHLANHVFSLVCAVMREFLGFAGAGVDA
jgi:hypothetical protein